MYPHWLSDSKDCFLTKRTEYDFRKFSPGLVLHSNNSRQAPDFKKLTVKATVIEVLSAGILALRIRVYSSFSAVSGARKDPRGSFTSLSSDHASVLVRRYPLRQQLIAPTTLQCSSDHPANHLLPLGN
jgi:hypothetical protein